MNNSGLLKKSQVISLLIAYQRKYAPSAGYKAYTDALISEIARMPEAAALSISTRETEIFRRAIDQYGKQAQVMMVFEEMSELQKELCKNWRGKDNIEEIADEAADVEIMLAQLKIIFQIEDQVQEHRQFKIARLAQRLENA